MLCSPVLYSLSSLVFRQHSEFSNEVDEVIKKYSIYIDTLRLKYDTDQSGYKESTVSINSQDLNDFTGVFVVFIFIILISLLVFAIELCLAKVRSFFI
jgi:hypothetical protein